MSTDGTISVKLGPLIKRDDGDEYLPLQLTVHGRSVTWINTELKKSEDNTFDYFYESSSYAANKGTISHPMPSIDPEVRLKLESLNLADKMVVKRAAAELCESIVKHEEPQIGREEPQIGIEEPQIGREEPQIGREEPQIGREEPQIGREGPRIGREESRIKFETPRIGESPTAQIVKNLETSIEYAEPKLLNCLKHDDPVSAVAVYNEWILIGCHDGTLHVWTVKGKHRLTINGHKASVTGVAWTFLKKDIANFVSVAENGTAVMWVCNIVKNSVIASTDYTYEHDGTNRFNACGVNKDKTIIAVAGSDATMKFWQIRPNKFGKYMKARKSQTISLTMKGHTDSITDLLWSGETEIISCSLDKTVKVWDCKSGKIKQEFTDRQPLYKVDYSPLCNSVIAANARNKIILYDPRAAAENARTLFNRYNEPVRCLKWSTVDQNLFILGGGLVQLWDIRNRKAPIFDLHDHEQEELCCDWSNPQFMIFGGQDKIVRIYKPI
ncbi:ribosome biogenesis protein WDR12 homolog [Augochlora pura]